MCPDKTFPLGYFMLHFIMFLIRQMTTKASNGLCISVTTGTMQNLMQMQALTLMLKAHSHCDSNDQGPVGLEQCPYFALYLLLIYRVEQLVTSTIYHSLSNVQLHMLCAFDLINWDFFIGWFTFQNKNTW